MNSKKNRKKSNDSYPIHIMDDINNNSTNNNSNSNNNKNNDKNNNDIE